MLPMGRHREVFEGRLGDCSRSFWDKFFSFIFAFEVADGRSLVIVTVSGRQMGDRTP